MVRTKGVILLFAAALGLAARPSLAAEPEGGEAENPSAAIERLWTVNVGLERLLFIGPYTQDGPNGQAGISVAAGGYMLSSDLERGEPFLPHAVPRLGVDIVLGEQITLGVAGGYGLSVADVGSSSGDPRHDATTSGTGVIVARLGHVGAMSRGGIHWVRAGLLYGFGSTLDVLALDVEFVLGKVLFPRGAFTFGVAADIGLYGTDSEAEGSEARRVHDAFGIWLGGLLFL